LNELLSQKTPDGEKIEKTLPGVKEKFQGLKAQKIAGGFLGNTFKR